MMVDIPDFFLTNFGRMCLECRDDVDKLIRDTSNLDNVIFYEELSDKMHGLFKLCLARERRLLAEQTVDYYTRRGVNAQKVIDKIYDYQI